MNFKPALLLAAASLLSFGAHAENETEIAPFAQWNFNANTPKASLSNGGAKLTTLGNLTLSYPNQSGSSDKGAAATGGSFSTTAYSAANCSTNLSCGLQFAVDTTGYENIVLTFDQRNSSTGSSYIALLYTVDGNSWLQATTFQTTSTSWVNDRSFNFSNIAEVDNNELFAFRLVAAYGPSGAYVGTSNAFAGTGTIRYDMVTLSGSMIPDVTTPVPEASTTAMLLAGLGLVGLVARRRRAD